LLSEGGFEHNARASNARQLQDAMQVQVYTGTERVQEDEGGQGVTGLCTVYRVQVAAPVTGIGLLQLGSPSLLGHRI